ncbi:MAG: HNH endonuclease signature motif containing protein [Vicinamibacterales bacterium]
MYRYDSDVQNHSRVAQGDVFVIRDRLRMLGTAKVQQVVSKPATKTRQRCPVCGTATLAERTSIVPRFRCAKKHEFDEPKRETVSCTAYEAKLADFVEAVDAVPVAALRAACPKYTSQSSIQVLDPGAIRWGLEATVAAAAAVLPKYVVTEGDSSQILTPGSAIDDEQSTDPEWVGHRDEREVVSRSIRLRRGQAAFRRALAERYGARCMVSGCALFDIVEAAHIAPYRGIADNAVVNGLLLRADLHTLFDLNLMGIDPQSLLVHLHPAAAAAGYGFLSGGLLDCGTTRPSAAALRERWRLFEAHDAVRLGA